MSTPLVAPPTVTVHANAEREVPADAYQLSAAVSGYGADAQAATAALVARYADLEAATATLAGVEIRHGAISTWPTNRKATQWEANRTLSVHSRDLPGVGAVADALSAVPDVALSGPNWRVERDNPAYAELQVEAVGEARERATRYATALGGTLGRLAQLRDPRAQMFAEQASAMARSSPELSTLDLTPQPSTVGAQVEATWYLVLPD